MTYNEWRETHGRYLWYHADGSARTTVPLDYNWAAIYKSVTDDADIHFHDWTIPDDVHYFTSQMYAAVPHGWFKYKTAFEMFAGTLDGTSINPDVFEAGFTRTTQHTLNNDNSYVDNDTVTETATGSATQAARTDTSNTQQRGINYQQGVQAVDDINNGNIGQLGNKYASALNDNVGNVTDNIGQQNVDSETSGTNKRTRNNSEALNETFSETVHETRINYYDNLAFLRDRMDRLHLFSPFFEYFQPLFALVESYRGDW